MFFKLKFSSRYKQIDFFKSNPGAAQSEVFFYLLNRAKNTDWGKKYKYNSFVDQKYFVKSLKCFQSLVPVSSYDDLSSEVNKILDKKKDVLWPGETKYLAKSSGTTGSKSKIIPISDEALSDCHYRGGEDVLASYYKINPETNVFFGKTVSIGGSFDNSFKELNCGDLSAILMKNIPFWAKPFRAPKISVALLNDWEEKMDKMAEDIINENIVALAGVPSWTLLVLKKVLDISGKKNISDLWPNLELFIHGGVSFGPYKKQFQEIISSPNMNYLEVYNASEGFFALNDDLKRDDMLLMLDIGVFYEFIPIEDFNKENPRIITVSDLELGKIYALLISTNGGLWRYLIGDTVEITSTLPVRIKIAGRTKHFINVFGEELMVGNTDKALEIALKKNDAIINDYTVCPIFMEGKTKGGHEWLIEFEKCPIDINKFIVDLDQALKGLNSDYEAKRYMNMILSLPKINIARKNLFYDWLKSKGKLGGQNKVPRLSNSRDYLEELLEFNS
ncbi:hypothetical protein CVU82_02305 [Candidatus Falkowbacteria bacterium HGW-Falkowbacteria-1]|uniref:GH3 auxin-responsive promoter n=1 Tax=Candidatus Falkowbacteria bacterium HGW-Falkowbacteria-1 TaxID=2013768 RepID=A0A2N2EA43_9BACT|nr:MAG: hypothetical protein CVU82_02305 [Candidatus Falkowbacteria bacterium HGW-Falkowbacteria-1]